MKINRFFRKYSRTLVLVFMSLLLVAFLIGDVLNSLSRGFRDQNERIGTAFGAPLHTSDLSRAERDMRLVGGLGLLGPAGSLFQQFNSLDYHLLTEEARRVGIRVGDEQVKQMLAQSGLSGERLGALRDNTRRSLHDIYQTIGEWLAVMELYSLQTEAVHESLPRLHRTFRQVREEASVQLAVLNARAFLPAVPEPTAEQIQQFFDEGKSRKTQHTETTLSFGYVFPDRVRLEYLTVDPKALEARIQVRDSEARRFYDEHTGQFYRLTTTPAAEPGGQPQAQRVQLSYEEAKEQVREAVRASKAVIEAQRIMSQLRDELEAPWRGAALGADHYRTPPSAEPLLSLEALRDKFASQYPLTYQRTELVDRDALRLEQPFANASIRLAEGQRTLAFLLAFRVKGLFAARANDPVPVLNVGEPSPLLFQYRSDQFTGTQQPGQAFLFRVLEAVPSGPPESLEAVRAQLVEDWKVAQAYATAAEWARKLHERAQQVGLAAALEEAAELRALLAQAQPASQPAGELPVDFLAELGPFDPARPGEPFTRNTGYIERVGTTVSVAREVFALADATASAAAHRVGLIPLATERKWVLAEVAGLQPLYQDAFAAARPQIEMQASRLAAQTLTLTWFDSEAIRRRVGYESPRPLAPPADAR